MGDDPVTAPDILGVVLAGGQSRRFGGDKAVAQLGRHRLIDHVAARARSQASALAINGRDYGLGLPVIPDAMTSEGPLTGVLSALQWARDAGFSAIVTFSCDAPFFPPDLVERLAGGLTPALSCTFASAGGSRHPAFAIWRTSVLGQLHQVYAAGTRSLMAAQDQVGAAAVMFAAGSGPQGDMFFNINHPDDLYPALEWLHQSGR